MFVHEFAHIVSLKKYLPWSEATVGFELGGLSEDEEWLRRWGANPVPNTNFDLGFSLTHLLSKAHHLPALRDEFGSAAARYWSSYQEAIGSGAWQEQLEPMSVRHTLGCLLARVAGRSPLEYLSQQERDTQQQAVCQLLDQPPAKMSELISEFLQRL